MQSVEAVRHWLKRVRRIQKSDFIALTKNNGTKQAAK